MQQIAIAWLALRLTNSPFALGITIATAVPPVPPASALGRPRRRPAPEADVCSLCTQTAADRAAAYVLWLCAGDAGRSQIWMVYALVLARGLVNVVDNPARQSFVAEMVGPRPPRERGLAERLGHPGGRLLGPAIAALIIATLGLGPVLPAERA